MKLNDRIDEAHPCSSTILQMSVIYFAPKFEQNCVHYTSIRMRKKFLQNKKVKL